MGFNREDSEQSNDGTSPVKCEKVYKKDKLDVLKKIKFTPCRQVAKVYMPLVQDIKWE